MCAHYLSDSYVTCRYYSRLKGLLVPSACSLWCINTSAWISENDYTLALKLQIFSCCSDIIFICIYVSTQLWTEQCTKWRLNTITGTATFPHTPFFRKQYKLRYFCLFFFYTMIQIRPVYSFNLNVFCAMSDSLLRSLFDVNKLRVAGWKRPAKLLCSLADFLCIINSKQRIIFTFWYMVSTTVMRVNKY